MLSEEVCKTWEYKLLLHERENVSYPDVKEREFGSDSYFSKVFITSKKGSPSQHRNFIKVYTNKIPGTLTSRQVV